MPPDRTRASDAEREDVVGALRAAAAEGRLDVDELDERCAAAYAAKTRGELIALLEDLPRPAPLPAPVAGPPMPTYAGYVERWQTSAGTERAVGEALQYAAPHLYALGYRLVRRGPTQLAFERRSRPAWTYIVAVLAFPIGLLALLHEDREQVTISFHAHAGQTVVIAQSTDPLTLRQAFAPLQR